CCRPSGRARGAGPLPERPAHRAMRGGSRATARERSLSVIRPVPLSASATGPMTLTGWRAQFVFAQHFADEPRAPSILVPRAVVVSIAMVVTVVRWVVAVVRRLLIAIHVDPSTRALA